MIGGYIQHPLKADKYTQYLLEAHIQEISSKLKKPLQTYRSLFYKTQIVNGVNYKIKVLLDDQEYIHVIIYVYTEEDREVSKLLTVMTNQTANSEI